jgi:hypothetical protein
MRQPLPAPKEDHHYAFSVIFFVDFVICCSRQMIHTALTGRC